MIAKADDLTRDHLIIPDSHAHPGFDNDRFTALGNYIIEKKPPVIVCIGDFADMPSLSAYDKGKRSFEGRRIKKDIEASLDAMEKMFAPIFKYNKKASNARRYQPLKIMCIGNHEDRFCRACNDIPELHGTIGIEDLKYEDYGWKVYPYKSTAILDGICYSHYFPSGVLGKAISGENIAKKMVATNHCSSVQGHSHVYNHYEHTRPDHVKLFGLSCGCYTHPDMVEGWNLNTHHLWWRGVITLEGAGRWPGYYQGIHAITQSKLMDDYL